MAWRSTGCWTRRTLAHRFYARQGEVLTEFAADEPVIRSTVLSGLPLRRAWLTPDQPPNVEDCLSESTASPVS